MSNHRLFWAINLPEDFKAGIYKQLHGLRQLSAPVKWVEQHNLHVTLNFLGDVKTNDINRIISTARRDITNLAGFTLNFTGLGFFPSPKRPRVVWVGVTGAVSKLTLLFQQLAISMATVGFSNQDHSFKPHLTIGRLRSPQGVSDLVQAINKIDSQPVNFGTCHVATLELMQSELTPKGPRYTVLASLKLR